MNVTKRIRLSNGRMLGFAEYGDPRGRPVFSFHGWPSSRMHLNPCEDAMGALSIRVIAPDRPGFGLSDYDPNRVLLDWPDTVLELADHLNLKKFSILGISGGGPYAAACAYKIGKRLHKAGIVAGLAPTYLPGVLDGMPWFTRTLWQQYGRIPHLSTVAAVSYMLMNRLSPSLGLYAKLFGAKADKELFVDIRVRSDFRRITGEAFRSGFRGPAHDLILYTRDWGYDLHQTRTHVYLWYGSDDKNVPVATGNIYHSLLPHNTYKVYPHEGHMIIRKHAKEILQTLVY